MSNFKLRGYVSRLTNADTLADVEKIIKQLKKDVPSKADQNWIYSQLDPIQKHNIESGFKPKYPQPNDWILHPEIGAGFILEIQENKAQIYWVDAYDATQYKQGNFVSGVSWINLSETKLISPPAHLKRQQLNHQKYSNLNEEEALIADFVAMAEAVADDIGGLKKYSECLREAYASGEISKQVIAKIYQQLPIEIKRKIDKIKAETNQ